MSASIIYLHGFNSASTDLSGQLLRNKPKLAILEDFCQSHHIRLITPNVDYRDFKEIVSTLMKLYTAEVEQDRRVFFMGSSMGGFTSEYMAISTGTQAIMINPVLKPTKLLLGFIGVTQNSETKEPYEWTQKHCDAYLEFEQEVERSRNLRICRTVFLDRDDELLNAKQTAEYYQPIARVEIFPGGSHSFDHMEQALPVLEEVIFAEQPDYQFSLDP